jgi:hypothetical protein
MTQIEASKSQPTRDIAFEIDDRQFSDCGNVCSIAAENVSSMENLTMENELDDTWVNNIAMQSVDAVSDIFSLILLLREPIT